MLEPATRKDFIRLAKLLVLVLHAHMTCHHHSSQIASQSIKFLETVQRFSRLVKPETDRKTSREKKTQVAYIEPCNIIIKARHFAESTQTSAALWTESVAKPLRGEIVALEAVFSGVPGDVRVLAVDHEIAIALADGTFFEWCLTRYVSISHEEERWCRWFFCRLRREKSNLRSFFGFLHLQLQVTVSWS